MEVGQDLRRSQESLESAVDVDSPHTLREPPQDGDNDGLGGSESKPSPQKRGAILNVLGVVERDTLAIAESFSSLFDSLRLALSEVHCHMILPHRTLISQLVFVKVTSSSVDHMHCFGDAVGCLQESALDAATKGNRFINSCLRLNEEMKGIENLASQLKFLRSNVDALDTAITRLLRPP
ncbi:uncharacterized protein LOC110820737 isoform X1 [Carica papaya]|uniref:uncharacterized protein LOC110820737 isoform X1 n=1 Tax=Carica papaya TaxID=3649 RepID=UPI000B8D12A9|nr:uncharacterized protein LOC110820737 isoform X1 [Carica papaya]